MLNWIPGYLDVVKYLVEKGIDIIAKNIWEETARDLASQKGKRAFGYTETTAYSSHGLHHISQHIEFSLFVHICTSK